MEARLTKLFEIHSGSAQIAAQPNILTAMLEVAKIQRAGDSNRIEGIYTFAARLTELVKEKAEPRNKNEQEIVG